MVLTPPLPILLGNPNPATPGNSPPRSSAAPDVSSSATAPDVSASENPRPRRQVSKFKDTFGIVRPYCGWFDFELNEDFDYTKNDDYEDEDDLYHVAEPREALIRYVNQIRKSFGFDVDCVVPSWFNGVFTYIDLEKAFKFDPYFCDYLFRLVNYALAEISAETGKKCELVKVDKVVCAHLGILFSTLRVKEVAVDGKEEEKIIQAIVSERISSKVMELHQWRYKPDEEDVWFRLPPYDPDYVGPPPTSDSEDDDEVYEIPPYDPNYVAPQLCSQLCSQLSSDSEDEEV